MQFYFAKAPHSSLPVHIVLEEIGLKYKATLVDLEAEPSEELLRLNPVGGVPILTLDDGQVLTEISAILQYLADQNPECKLAPEWGSMERYRLQEWLSFIGTELHKGFWPLKFVAELKEFPSASEDLAKHLIKNLQFKLDVTAKRLGSKPYALSSGYSVADPYLYTILTWASQIGLSLTPWPTLVEYIDRISMRPATQQALKLARGVA